MTAAEIEALAKGAPELPIALYIVSATEGGTALLQMGRPADKYGKNNFSATPADAALLSALVNSLPEICAAMRLAEAVDERERLYEEMGCACQFDAEGRRELECEACGALEVAEQALTLYRASKEPRK